MTVAIWPTSNYIQELVHRFESHYGRLPANVNECVRVHTHVCTCACMYVMYTCVCVCVCETDWSYKWQSALWLLIPASSYVIFIANNKVQQLPISTISGVYNKTLAQVNSRQFYTSIQPMSVLYTSYLTHTHTHADFGYNTDSRC